MDEAAAAVFALVAMVDAVARAIPVGFVSDAEGTVEEGFARVVDLSLVFTAFSLLFTTVPRVARVVRRTCMICELEIAEIRVEN